MKNYAPENAFFKLPFKIDSKLLLKDLKTAEKFTFIDHYVTSNFSRDYKLLPLRSINGSLTNGFATEIQTYQNTGVLDKCNYFKEIIAGFQCNKKSIRLMCLPPNDSVNLHTDFECGYEDGLFRIHIPIITNDKVSFNINDEIIQMKTEEVWYINFNLPHSVKNEGNTKRVHLVIDCIRNSWSDQLFKSLGYRFDLEDKQENFDRTTVIRMIEELEQQNNEASDILIKDLKAKLNDIRD